MRGEQWLTHNITKTIKDVEPFSEIGGSVNKKLKEIPVSSIAEIRAIEENKKENHYKCW